MYARSSLAEHLPNPVTPLFGTLGLRLANEGSAKLFQEMIGADPSSSDYQYVPINGYVYMGIRLTARSAWSITKGSLAQFGPMMRTGLAKWRAARPVLEQAAAQWEGRPAARLTAAELLDGARELVLESARFYNVIQAGPLPIASSSEIVFSRVYNLIRRKGDPEAQALLFGFDTAAQRSEKSLFDLAGWVRERPPLRQYALAAPAARLAADMSHDQPPAEVAAADWQEWRARFERHLREFGRTAYELDFANPTPAETPETLLQVIKAYLEGQGINPYERQRQAVALRERTTQAILGRRLWFPKRWFTSLLEWAQEAGPAREDSIAEMGLAYPALRRLLGELGRRLAAGGAIQSAEDIYWLKEAELADLAARLDGGEALPALCERVVSRKATWRQQLQAMPPIMLPQKSRLARMVPWSRTDQAGNVLKGLGTSTGKATGPARVLHGPEQFGQMQSGDVLVAVTTTPAWTPLFALASAVVTDIGGPLSHSSIVAREYGIPAVMATGAATRRIRSGNVVTVDGSAGTVTLPARSNGRAGG
jgi:pyruvate,water dikinase